MRSYTEINKYPLYNDKVPRRVFLSSLFLQGISQAYICQIAHGDTSFCKNMKCVIAGLSNNYILLIESWLEQGADPYTLN